MSAAVRFLAVAIVGWAVVRASSLGLVPGATAFSPAQAAETGLPPIVPTSFPPIEPVVYGPQHMPQAGIPPAAWQGRPVQISPSAVRVYFDRPDAPMQMASAPLEPRRFPHAPLDERASFYAPVPSLDEWDLASAGVPMPIAGQSRPTFRTGQSAAGPAKLDRWQMSSWALLRGRPGQSTLASGGTLGGSQAGARLTYAIDRRLALSLRTSSPVGGVSGGEVAAGVRVQPVLSVPVAITAERRQAIGRYGGRSDFALFAEGGLYQRPLPWNLSLDAYGQAGVVGIKSRDLFADGSLVVSRPLFGRFSAGFGLWGGAQPGLYRVDAGPRLSMRVRRNVSVHLDWRQRLAGDALPGSGPALTMAADF